MLGDGLLIPDTLGGVMVDFDTCESAQGLYCIGNLTKGTHFYTNAVNRNIAHAKRVADHLSPPLKIAFFIGSDIMSHLMVNELVPRLIAMGHTPAIYLPSDTVNSGKKPHALEELTFFERKLLQNHVTPYLNGRNISGDVLTLTQLGERYGIEAHSIESVNDPAFIKSLNFDLGFSLRCYQRFGAEIINSFEGKLLNLHPGILPHYRGVMTAIRAMANNSPYHGYTLHHIDPSFDTGPIVAIKKIPIDYTKSMLSNMNTAYPTGIEMIVEAVQQYALGELPASLPQEEGAYYSFPNEKDLDEYEDRGLRLVYPEDVELLFTRFSTDSAFISYLHEICQATQTFLLASNTETKEKPKSLTR